MYTDIQRHIKKKAVLNGVEGVVTRTEAHMRTCIYIIWKCTTPMPPLFWDPNRGYKTQTT